MSDFERKEIAVAIVRRSDGAVLVGERPADVPLAGYSEFPGGKINALELPLAAAERECFEETGLVATVTDKLAVVDHDYEHGTLRLHFFSAKPSDDKQTPKSPFRWVDFESLSTLEFPPANQTVLELMGATGGPKS